MGTISESFIYFILPFTSKINIFFQPGLLKFMIDFTYIILYVNVIFYKHNFSATYPGLNS